MTANIPIKLGSTVYDVNDVFLLIRHVLTAGHCLCKYEDAEPLLAMENWNFTLDI